MSSTITTMSLLHLPTQGATTSLGSPLFYLQTLLIPLEICFIVFYFHGSLAKKNVRNLNHSEDLLSPRINKILPCLYIVSMHIKSSKMFGKVTH